MINRLKAKKERIAFAPMNLPLDERSRLSRNRSSGPLGGCKLPAVDMCGSQSADTIKMNFRSQAPQLVDLSGLGRLQGRSGRGQTRRNAVEDAWGPNRLSDPPNVRGPSEGVNSWGDRATALIESICFEKIRGCSCRASNTSALGRAPRNREYHRAMRRSL